MPRGRTRGIAVAAVAALIALAAPSAASAQVQTVTANVFTDDTPPGNITGADCTPAHCTLREAVEAFSPARIVQLLPGTYELTQNAPLNVDGIKTINGAGATIDANKQSGAVAIVEGATAVINDVTITGGLASGQVFGEGGGINIGTAASLQLNRSAVVGNQAPQTGGGISNPSNGDVDITDSTISGNAIIAAVGGAGGGIYTASGSTTRLFNTTISGNQAGLRTNGAGIFAQGALEMTHVTIAGNVVGTGSSLFVTSTATTGPPPLPIWNSIVASDTGVACDITNRTYNGDHNLDDDGTCGFSRLGDKPGVNPLLGPLANNGGPTNTHALSPVSPAINAASQATCLGTDQRGALRPAGACDMGAFEYVTPTLRVVTQVVNDQGGTRDPSEFSVHVTAGFDVGGSPQPGSGAGTTYTLPAGAYTVSADALAGYAFTVSGDCAADGTVSLAESQAKTCTIVANDPPPVANKSVNAIPKSGTVRIKLPGKNRRFRQLVEGEQIPVGTTIDTLRGRVTLVAAADKKGKTATADFYDGIFKVLQTKSLITRLVLTERLSCGNAGKANAAAKRKRKRRLWGDGSGRFRTEGEFSSATVRGTRWLTEDRCASTLTKVRRGRVAVRDLVKHKTIIVRAGKQYVARAKK